MVTAENSQLGAHVQLLESELDSARHGQATDSTEGSPRQSQLMVEAMPHGVTPAHLDMPEAASQIPSAVSGMRPLINVGSIGLGTRLLKACCNDKGFPRPS